MTQQKRNDARVWPGMQDTMDALVLDQLGCSFGILTCILPGLRGERYLAYLGGVGLYLLQLLLLLRHPSTYMKYRTGILVYHRLHFLAIFASEVSSGRLQAFAAESEIEPAARYFLAITTCWAHAINNVFFSIPWRWFAALQAISAAVQAHVVKQVACSLQRVAAPYLLAKACSVIRYGSSSGSVCSDGATAASIAALVSSFFGITAPTCFAYWYAQRTKANALKRKDQDVQIPSSWHTILSKAGVLTFWAVVSVCIAHFATYPDVLVPSQCLAAGTH